MKPKIIVIISSLLFCLFANAQTDLIYKNGMEFVARLNDTGITWAGEYSSGNNADCNSTTITSPQDCSTGRDGNPLTNSNTDGHAGFSFTKLDANGTPLADQSVDYVTTPWSCVQDNVTGLIWEVKATDGGLHDNNDRYNWYNTNSATNGGDDGYADDDGAICYGYDNLDSSTFCNTQAYTSRVNSQGLCGQTDWRMPDINELHSIVHQGKINPTIDASYFPNTVSSYFWSSSPYASSSNGAWELNFGSGYGGNGGRLSDYNVRLVRGEQ